MVITDRPTPFAVVDEAVLRRNIAVMQARVEAAGATMRPHVKTHKTKQIARMQVAAGARGITVATIAEAEAFAAAGFDDLFIAYPLWLDEARGARLAALTARADVRVGTDSPDGARRIARYAPDARVLVEIDSGMRRSGVAPQEAGLVASAAARAGLAVDGVFTFPGHSYAPDGGREAAAAQERAALALGAEALAGVGLPAGVVSGGSSPSIEFTRADSATELRPGVYVAQDAQQWELGACGRGDVALTIYATVVSHAGGRVVLDAGNKALGPDRPGYCHGHGRLLDHLDARIVLLSEHHAVADLAGDRPPPLGSVVRVVPNHACTAFNLVEEVVVAGESRGPSEGPAATIADVWPLIARGANG